MSSHMTKVLAEAICQGKTLNLDFQGYGYRVLRGKADKDFETLTDTPLTRRVVFLSPFEDIVFGKTGWDVLEKVCGYPTQDINHYLEGGTHFRVVVFKLDPKGPIKPATWLNVVDVLKDAYPKIGVFRDIKGEANKKLARALHSVPFSFYESMFGGPGSFDRIKKAGPNSPAYVTVERLEKMQRLELEEGIAVITPAVIRLFLYLNCNFNKLFTGDGYTADEIGNYGVPEYIVANAPLSQLGEHTLLPLNVIPPK